MTDFKDLAPYAEWLEQLCKTIARYKPERIAVAMDCEKSTISDYWGDMSSYDIMHLSDIIRIDGILDAVNGDAEGIREEDEDKDEDAD